MSTDVIRQAAAVAQARTESIVLFDQVNYDRNPNPLPKPVVEKSLNAQWLTAGADGLSEKEIMFITKFAESQGWPFIDKEKLSTLDTNTCMQELKDVLQAGGFKGPLAKIAVVDICYKCLRACGSDGDVSEAERESIVSVCKWWEADPEKVIAWGEEFNALGEKVLAKKMAIILGAPDADWKYTPVDGYGVDNPTWLSFERMYFCKSTVALELADIKKQMHCFATIAAADGLSDLERAWCTSYAQYCGGGQLDFDTLPPLESVPSIIEEIAVRSGLDKKQLATEMIYNCIRCASVDGQSPSEKTAISQVTTALQIEESVVAELNALVLEELDLRKPLIDKLGEVIDADPQELAAALENCFAE